MKGNPSSAYQVYLSVDNSILTQMDTITTTANSINTNTTYEDNANLKVAQTDLLSAAANYNTSYKDARRAMADLSSPPGGTLAQENYTTGMDSAHSQYQQGDTKYASVSSTYLTLWAGDSNTKTKNGCNPAGFQVYSDIADKVNNGLTCAQDGYTTGLDATMCRLYVEGTIQQRSTWGWVIINRPTSQRSDTLTNIANALTALASILEKMKAGGL